MNDNKLGRHILKTSHQIKIRLDYLFSNDEINGLQARIMGFIHSNEKKGAQIFQKDIESEFKIRRSSVTSVLNTMEKNGLIIRQSVENDARLKRIVLTDKSKAIVDRHNEKLKEFEKIIINDLTETEITVLNNLLDRIEKNLEKIEVKQK